MPGMLPKLKSQWRCNASNAIVVVCHVAPNTDSGQLMVAWDEFNGRDWRTGSTPLEKFVMGYTWVSDPNGDTRVVPRGGSSTAPPKQAPGGWRRGPLPEGTWGWGGVRTKGMTSGFLYADFCGSFARVCAGEDVADKVVYAADIVLWNNDLTEPAPEEVVK